MRSLSLGDWGDSKARPACSVVKADARPNHASHVPASRFLRVRRRTGAANRPVLVVPNTTRATPVTYARPSRITARCRVHGTYMTGRPGSVNRNFKPTSPAWAAATCVCHRDDRLGKQSHPLNSARPDLRPALTKCLRLLAAPTRRGCARGGVTRGLKGVRVLHDTLNSLGRKLRSVLISAGGSLKWRRPGRDSPMVAPWHFHIDNA